MSHGGNTVDYEMRSDDVSRSNGGLGPMMNPGVSQE